MKILQTRIKKIVKNAELQVNKDEADSAHMDMEKVIEKEPATTTGRKKRTKETELQAKDFDIVAHWNKNIKNHFGSTALSDLLEKQLPYFSCCK